MGIEYPAQNQRLCRVVKSQQKRLWDKINFSSTVFLPKQMSNRATSFLLTVFKKGGSKDKEEDYAVLTDWWEAMRTKDAVGFMMGQIEMGDKENHAHIQAYMETKLVGKDFAKIALKGVRSMLDFGFNDIEGHIEACKSPEDAKIYVQKMDGRIMALSSIGEMRVGRYDKLYLRMIGTYVPGTITTHSFI